MAKIEPKIFDELKTALVSFGDKYFVGEELNRSKLTDDLRNYDEALLSKLFDEIDRWLHKELAKNIVNGKQITQNIIPNLSFFLRTANLFFSNIFFKNKKIVRSNKCKKKLFVKMTGNISISFPSKSLVKFNGNQKILK